MLSAKRWQDHSMEQDGGDLPRNKSARRRELQRRRREVAHTERMTRSSSRSPDLQHRHDPIEVLNRLTTDAAVHRVDALIGLTDQQLSLLPDGMVEFARHQFQTMAPLTDSDLERLVHLVAAVTVLWATTQPDEQDALATMSGRCGLVHDTVERGTATDHSWAIRPGGQFASIAMLVANRVALVGEAM